MKIKAKRGGVEVDLTMEETQYFDRFTRGVAPVTRAALDEAIEKVYNDAVARWPVKTGTSRAGLDYGIMFTSLDSLRGYVRNDVGYAKYIRTRGLPKTGSAFVELMRKPMQEEAKRLAFVLSDEIAAAVAGRKR